MKKNEKVKLSLDSKCPYCGSDNIEKVGIEGGTIAQGSSKFVPGLVGYNCIDCGGYFHEKAN